MIDLDATRARWEGLVLHLGTDDHEKNCRCFLCMALGSFAALVIEVERLRAENAHRRAQAEVCPYCDETVSS